MSDKAEGVLTAGLGAVGKETDRILWFSPLGLWGTAPRSRELSSQNHSFIHTVISCRPSAVLRVTETNTAKPVVLTLWDSTRGETEV